MADRQYLSVPYAERDEAKAAGARWDKTAKQWYVGPKADAEAMVARWRQRPRAELSEADIRASFASAMRDLGLNPTGQHPIMDGKPHRVPIEGEKGGRVSGRYVGYLDGHPAGHIKNYKSGVDTPWKLEGVTIAPEESARMRAEFEAKSEARAAERAATFDATARRVARHTERLLPLVQPTPYMVAKGISPAEGALTDRDGQTTYLPAIDTAGRQWTMQYIRDDGSKRFAKDSLKEGNFHIAGGNLETLAKAPVIIIGEGYATVRTVGDEVGHATVAAFDSGNLQAVAVALHNKFPDKPILIVGDDDRAEELKGRPNPGKEKALAAASAVDGLAVFPVFGKERDADPGAYSDFNDLKMKSPDGHVATSLQIAEAVRDVVFAHAERDRLQRETDATKDRPMPDNTNAEPDRDAQRTPPVAPVSERPDAARSAPEPAPVKPDADRESSSGRTFPEGAALAAQPDRASEPAPQAAPARKAADDEKGRSDNDAPTPANENTIGPVPAESTRDRVPGAAAAGVAAIDRDSRVDPDRPAAPSRDAPSEPERADTPAAKKREASLEAGDVPEEIARRYYVQKSKWSGEPGFYESSTATDPAFRDQGGKLVATTDSPATARDLVAVAEHRGWGEIQVSGTDAFKREIWLQAMQKDIAVRGFKPSERDLQELSRLREAAADRLNNTVVPVERGGPDRASARAPDAGDRVPGANVADRAAGAGAADRGPDFKDGVRGKLIETGRAEFKAGDPSSSSPYAEIELGNGDRKRAWGIGIPDALARSGVAVGDDVVVQRLGRETVQVPQRVQDKETGEWSTKTVEAQRNRWSVEQAEPDRQQSRDRAANDRAAPSAESRNPDPAQSRAPADAADRRAARAPQREAVADRDGASRQRDAAPAERQYLAVPYKDRQAAKDAGARWDGAEKRWYVGERADPAKLERFAVRDQVSDRETKLIGADRTARAQMKVIESVVGKALADNPDAARKMLSTARAQLADRVEQGSAIRVPQVRGGPDRSQSQPSAAAPRQPGAGRAAGDAPPAPPTPRREPPQRSRGR
ncbi:DUF5710 domain-containing protein [Sphingomonas prati]|uniref:Phage/plasmid primase-like uncharacterized protein n=1 Tax=Sphingomonas prati TaxID=1843237 RepID=A0A7W9BVI4_9SPHN|nr:DUF5710 domain-containing protein [Sphingomonas prati]MBB5730904.1 phage/plasmid primase-like uncharacterized protein [Sphingomonas prati]GGE97709.1 hypothetical protein GCM10011404_33580 [Sphingomonas prati]